MTDNLQLSKLIRMDSPEAVLDEVLIILGMISPDLDAAPVTSAFNTVVGLYKGAHPGYQACNTEYHDLCHTTDTFLAMARLIHGAKLDGETFTQRHIVLGLISVLLHDTGYILEKHDREGTGAKHTVSHVQRSMDFMERHGAEYGLSNEEIAAGRAMILCTDLVADVSAIAFSSPSIKLLGKILGTADLIAQMADRTYLEKLLFLYREFKEGNVGDYEGETDLLRKTIKFHELIAQRFKMMLDGTDRFMNSHFTSRWDIHANLYHEAIEKQRNYLKQILEIPGADLRNHLKRYGIVEKVRKKYGKSE